MKLRLWVRLLGLCAALAAANPAPAKATLAAPLATPDDLAADVRFWELVFDKYDADDCVFHDKDDLGIIYTVKALKGSPVQKSRFTSRYLAWIRTSIRRLGDGKEPSTPIEHRIVAVTPPQRRYPAYYRYAAENVRCQRGVDLQPSLVRSKQHLRMVKRILADHHIPTDLAYLPHLESGYDPKARSRVGARGIWQFMPATARLFNLPVSRRSDERTNPLRSTQAAAAMLQDMHGQTGSWPLTITAFNYGINGTMRAIKLYGNDYMSVRAKHQTSMFGFAARNYYPSFLAVRNVLSKGEGLSTTRSKRETRF